MRAREARHPEAGDTKKPDFLKLNPNGSVPTLVHDGVAIWESAAITIYLGETFGVETKLWPAAGPKRGEAMKWVVWANVTLGERVYRWARNTMWVPEDQRNAKAAEAGDARTSQDLLRMLDGALEGRPFLAGEYTLADAHVNSFVDWLRHMKIDMTGLYAPRRVEQALQRAPRVQEANGAGLRRTDATPRADRRPRRRPARDEGPARGRTHCGRRVGRPSLPEGRAVEPPQVRRHVREHEVDPLGWDAKRLVQAAG